MLKEISLIKPEDRATWLSMRRQLWPNTPDTKHLEEMDKILANPKASWSYMVKVDSLTAVGFAEVSIRDYANGCESQPVPFLEGIWVEPDHQRQGIGKALLNRIEEDITELGFSEIGSDADLENLGSHKAHKGWGFEETQRVVYFRKQILSNPK